MGHFCFWSSSSSSFCILACKSLECKSLGSWYRCDKDHGNEGTAACSCISFVVGNQNPFFFFFFFFSWIALASWLLFQILNLNSVDIIFWIAEMGEAFWSLQAASCVCECPPAESCEKGNALNSCGYVAIAFVKNHGQIATAVSLWRPMMPCGSIGMSLQMLDTARELLSERLAKEPTLLLMILGIPNVGKSALVNSLFHLSHSSTSGKVFPSRVSLGDVCKHAILVSCYSGLLHDIMTESSPCCLQKCNSRSGHRIMYTYFAEFWTHFCCT